MIEPSLRQCCHMGTHNFRPPPPAFLVLPWALVEVLDQYPPLRDLWHQVLRLLRDNMLLRMRNIDFSRYHLFFFGCAFALWFGFGFTIGHICFHLWLTSTFRLNFLFYYITVRFLRLRVWGNRQMGQRRFQLNTFVP